MTQCQWCDILIDPNCDSEHHVEAEGEDYTICDACHNDYLIGRIPAWV